MIFLSFRKEGLFLLAVLCVLVLISGHTTFAEGQASKPPGMCYIRNSHTNAPGLSGPDVGRGYARIVKPGVYTIGELREVCTKADYDSLFDKLCANNPDETDQYYAGEVSDNVSTIGGCTAPGCVYFHGCPKPPSPPPPPPTPFNFTISTGGNRSVIQGSSVVNPVTVTLVSGATAPVSFSAYGLPVGVTATFSTESCSPTCSMNLTISTIAATPLGDFTITVISRGALARTATFVLTVNEEPLSPPPPPPLPTTPPDEAKSSLYPAVELGNCKSEAECHAYCDQPENSRACLVFVKKHNLLTQEEIARWEEFIDVASGGGPGGCRNEKECINYCEDASHIVTCTDFVAKHNLVSPEELAEMQKIAKAVKAGAHLPGNCRGKAACVAYCEIGAHVDECLAFAEKAELLSPEEIAEAKKFAPFIKRGETPGGCTSKAACVTYCTDESHSDECISFLAKAGFMTQKQADFVKKFKGKSPGDCAKGKTKFEDAQQSCNAFCNDPTNQPVCFRFLEDAGIMTAEEATQAGSMSDFQACIPSAPEEVKQCFITHLGQDLFDAMRQGAMPLAEDVEDMMKKIREARKCVNRYTDQSLASFTDSPDALACIDSQLGKDYLEKAKRGEVKCGDAAQSQKKIESCMEGAISAKLDHCFALACSEATTCLQGFQKPGKGEERQMNPDLKAKIENKVNACVAEEIRGCLTKDCGEMMSCINKLQSQASDQKGESNLDPAIEQELTAKMTSCTKQDQQDQQNSREQPSTNPSPGDQHQAPDQNPSSGDQIPQEYCSGFASVPDCSYVGASDSQNYKYCKQCYPDK